MLTVPSENVSLCNRELNPRISFFLNVQITDLLQGRKYINFMIFDLNISCVSLPTLDIHIKIVKK